MKVICKKNTAKGLNLEEVKTLFIDEYRYRLEIGREYVVMGIVTYKNSNCPYYLIDHDGRPDWFPYVLFDVIDNSLPENWYIRVFNKGEAGNLFTLIGFDELCNDDDFHDALLNRDETAMKIYRERRMAVKNDVY